MSTVLSGVYSLEVHGTTTSINGRTNILLAHSRWEPAMVTCFSEADVAGHGRGVRVHPPFTFAPTRAEGRGWGQITSLISTFVGVSTWGRGLKVDNTLSSTG